MAPNRDGRSDGSRREHSHIRHRQSSRSKRYDQDSIDSGYGGSSANASPRLSQPKPADGEFPVPTASEAMPKHDATDANVSAGENTESNSDYDPKAKYHITMNDDDYANISFQGVEPGQPESSDPKGKRREGERNSTARRRRRTNDRHKSSSHRHRSDSRSSSESDYTSTRRRHGRSQQLSCRNSDSSDSKRQWDSARRQLSPICSDNEDWRTSLERRHRPRTRSEPRGSRRSRSSSTSSSDYGERETDAKAQSSRTSDKAQRASIERSTRNESKQKRGLSEDAGSSSLKGMPDMDDVWYKTFKEKLTKGVDMAQVRKVGFDAAAVAALKVAVGTQIPWKQRIPKTIAVGLAAAVTDFLVSKTSMKPKSMLGTMYVRQLVEVALANLIINPTSNKVQQKFAGQKAGSGTDMNKPAGGRARLGASAAGPGARGSGGGGGRR